jgi:hypothetical protein
MPSTFLSTPARRRAQPSILIYSARRQQYETHDSLSINHEPLGSRILLVDRASATKTREVRRRPELGSNQTLRRISQDERVVEHTLRLEPNALERPDDGWILARCEWNIGKVESGGEGRAAPGWVRHLVGCDLEVKAGRRIQLAWAIEIRT